ncbi:hypothetical protein J2Z57_003634 [Formosa algae]|uniref:Uncharacterized protein n=1 Tax=Formosa algae TaxID=225843 RepID=A0A9X0YMS2_9FLAO|nr:hypothetical protein [Formosa algae]MDQ0337172.1 hypothetical protein [Formosa algae]
MEQHNFQDLGIMYADAITNHPEDLNDAIWRVKHYLDLITKAIVDHIIKL